MNGLRKRNVKVYKRSLNCYQIRFSYIGIRYSIFGRTKFECRKNYIEKLKELKPPKLEKSGSFYSFYCQWIDLYKKPFVTTQTLNLILGIFNKHILPKIADIPLKRISTYQIQEIVNSMYSTPRQATIAFQQLNSCLKQAYKLNFIRFNPCSAVVIVKNKGKKGQALTKEQEQQLLQFLDKTNHEYKNLIKLYLYTGMRRNELLNIKYKDINFIKNEIYIKGTKTQNSERILQTSPQILKLFPKKEQPFSEINPNVLNHKFKKICDLLHFKNIVLHSLRHTFATRCIENGVNMAVVQSWLGHSSIKMTIDTYTHISEDFKFMEVKKLPFLFANL